jgi:acetyl esterase
MNTRSAIAVLFAIFWGLSVFSQVQLAKNKFVCARNILWANPNDMPLTMDIYTPDTGRESYPVVVIYHGGGWLINQKEIMDSLSVYLVSHADYVVCNVNYRLLGDLGNTVGMNQIVEDALGAVVWVQHNIGKYKGNGKRIAVTGDSAGGQLAAMVALCGRQLESDGFTGPTLGFNPTWLPANTSADDLAKQGGVQVQAALLSYPAVDMFKTCVQGFETIGNPFWLFANQKHRGIFGDTATVKSHPHFYKAVSPIHNIPSAQTRLLPPQFCMVGSLDVVTSPASVKEYVDKCIEAGQPMEYWVYKGRPHAFLDSKKQPAIGVDFTRDGPEAIGRMIAFLDKVFYGGANDK